MAVRYMQPGTMELYGKMGEGIGKAKAIRTDIARADALAREGRARQHQYNMANMSEEFRRQAETRAMEWEMEKLELNSKYQFQRRLQEEDFWRDRKMMDEAKKVEKFEQAKELIEGDNTIPARQKEDLLRRVELKYLGFPQPQQRQDALSLMMQSSGMGINAPAAQPVHPETARKWNIKTIAGMQIITKGGVDYKVVGMYPDGEPDVVPLTPSFRGAGASGGWGNEPARPPSPNYGRF